ncbi:hypothetical protein Tco_0864496, partial [Tanacetum coccineum]
FDPQLLVEHFTPVEDNTGVLESDELEDYTCLQLLKDVRGSANLTFLTLFMGVTATFLVLGVWKRISEKKMKNQAKTDKTKHGMEKRGKAKVKSKPKSTKAKVKSKLKSTKVKVKVNPEKSTVNTEADIEEY